MNKTIAFFITFTMNVIFSIILILSLIILIIFEPNSLFTCFTTSTNNAFSLMLKLLSIYFIWLGFSEILTKSKASNKISKLFSPLIKKLFKVNDQKTIDELSLNLTASLLGISGLSTPTAINSMQYLDDQKNEYAKTLLFVLSATSIQILPLSVMQLMAEHGSKNPSIIFIPTLFTTLVSTIIGIILVKVFK